MSAVTLHADRAVVVYPVAGYELALLGTMARQVGLCWAGAGLFAGAAAVSLSPIFVAPLVLAVAVAIVETRRLRDFLERIVEEAKPPEAERQAMRGTE